jgi:hypothetical protein
VLKLKIIKMKNIFKILSMVAVGVMFITACQKDPLLPMPELQQAVIPLITKDAARNQSISLNDLPGFKGSVVVNIYYKDMPKSMNLMVCMNGDVENSAIVKSDITSFPTTVDFTIGTLIDLLPKLNNINELKLGDNFLFYVDITLKDGSVVKGNDPSYASFDPGVINLPGSSVNVTYTIACPLVPALTVGSYLAYSPPSDWNSTGNITLTAAPGDPNTIYVAGLATIDGESEDLGPLVMHINPVTFAVTADKTVIDSDFYGFTNYAFEGTGTYNTCTGLYTMKFKISADGADWGENNYTFTRN